MGTPSVGRQELRKQRTRAAVQNAALALFAERGYRATTMDAIAEAADVALRTVTIHFPTKADLLFDGDPFTLDTLAVRLDERPPGASALRVVRDWMHATMRELGERAEGEDIWRRRSLRARVIGADPELLARARAGYYPYEQLIAAHLCRDAGLPPDAIAPRLAAIAVVAGLRELYLSAEAQEAGGEGVGNATAVDAASGGHGGVTAAGTLSELVDRVIDFAVAGLAAGEAGPDVRRS